MLFSDPAFLLLFLPLTLAVWWRLLACGRDGAAQGFVVCASLFFYGSWNWACLPLLAASMLLNFHAGKALAAAPSRRLLALGLAFNLGLLAYFKYTGFMLENLGGLLGLSLSFPGVAIPLGISFFTFQKIAFLVDCHRGRAGGFSLRRFAFFVSFFPQLVAGPIVHHAGLIPQIERRIRFDPALFGQGLFLAVLGLFKKTVIADRLATIVDPLFDAAHPLPLAEAWTAATGYGLQLYFDFSGYSEMAVGMAMLFGLRLPDNFNSPYQAASITDFWRRWHMSLSRFLRDYLYIPLGGNRHGFGRGLAAVFATFLLGGLWHGAGWTYLMWGTLHGGFICIHRIWAKAGMKMPRQAGMAFTYLAVTFAWVMFRSGSMGQACSIWKGMLGWNGAALPYGFREFCPECATTTLASGLEAAPLLILLAWCMARPNAHETAAQIKPTSSSLARLALAALACSFLASANQSFIYWQF